MQVLNRQRVFHCHQGAFIRGFSVGKSFLHSTSKHGNAGSTSKVSVQSILFHFAEFLCSGTGLILSIGSRHTFNHHIPTEFTGENNECSIQNSFGFQITNQLCDWLINFLFHAGGSGMPIFMRIPMKEGNIFSGYFDKAGTFLHQSAGQQTSSSKACISILCVGILGFAGKIKCIFFLGLK